MSVTPFEEKGTLIRSESKSASGAAHNNNGVMRCVTLRFVADITLHYLTLRYVTLRYVTLCYIALHGIALHYITLHCIALHCIALHCIALHCIALQCIEIALHYIIM